MSVTHSNSDLIVRLQETAEELLRQIRTPNADSPVRITIAVGKTTITVSSSPLISRQGRERNLQTGMRFVYCIEAVSSHRIKIGSAADPKRRLDGMQTACPEELRLLATCLGSRELEVELHERFAEYRIRGEWFNDCPEIRNFIAKNMNPWPEDEGLESDYFSPCISDILEVITAANRPLTTTMIFEALEQANKKWSLRTLSYYLKMMMDNGTLENPKGSKPGGYRLPASNSA